MVDDTDWRLQGQEYFLQGAEVTYRKYRRTNHSWDHDHCEFCGAKFMEKSTDPDVQAEGYCTVHENRWICTSCLSDFKERFALTVRDQTGDRM